MNGLAPSRGGGWKPLVAAGLAALAASLFVLWLSVVGSEFQGADDAAGEAIVEIAPGTEPWFTPLWSPDEGTEKLLFALQAASGAGIVAYILARKRYASR